MLVLGERVIAYLKTDATLIGASYLGNASNIYAMSMPVNKNKAVVVSTNPGSDGNNIPINSGTLSVSVVVKREVEDASILCFNIAKRVDDLLNLGESNITNDTYAVLHINRVGEGSGVLYSNEYKEYFFNLDYSFILKRS